MKVRKRKRPAPTIPLSAMSDIALLLLIFFIVTTQFLVQKSIPAEIPVPTPDKSKASEDEITVIVEDDCVYLNEERIDLDELAQFLYAKLVDKTKAEDRSVIVDAKPSVKWQRVTTACNEIKRAGGIVTIYKVEE